MEKDLHHHHEMPIIKQKSESYPFRFLWLLIFALHEYAPSMKYKAQVARVSHTYIVIQKISEIVGGIVFECGQNTSNLKSRVIELSLYNMFLIYIYKPNATTDYKKFNDIDKITAFSFISLHKHHLNESHLRYLRERQN